MRHSTAPIVPLVMPVVIVTVLAVTLTGCLGGNNQPPPGTHNVGMSGLAFVPSTLTIQVGENVTWTNNEAVTHTVVSDNATDPFSSGVLSYGQTYTHRFNQVGVFPYHCSLHPGMTGTITVVA